MSRLSMLGAIMPGPGGRAEPVGGGRCKGPVSTKGGPMSPRLTAVLAVSLAMGVASPAQAKGIVDPEVCGASGCRAVSAWDAHVRLETGRPAAAPQRPAPFYELRYRFMRDPAASAANEETELVRLRFVP